MVRKLQRIQPHPVNHHAHQAERNVEDMTEKYHNRRGPHGQPCRPELKHTLPHIVETRCDVVTRQPHRKQTDVRQDIHKTVDDAEAADLVFSQLMGEEVAPRSEFIEKNAKFVKNLDI